MTLADEVRQKTKLTWADGTPWLVETSVGQGLVWNLALPFDPSTSDLVLRPGCIALLGRFLNLARQRQGRKEITVGHPWSMEGVERLELVEPRERDAAIHRGPHGPEFVAPQAGPWNLRANDRVRTVVARIDPKEILAPLRSIVEGSGTANRGTATARINVSRYVAWFILLLSLAEAAWALVSAQRGKGEPTAS